MKRKAVTVSLDANLLAQVDALRGVVPRSRVLEMSLRLHLPEIEPALAHLLEKAA